MLQVGAAVLGVPVKPTIKEVDSDGRVVKTLQRAMLWEVQTPQVPSPRTLTFVSWLRFVVIWAPHAALLAREAIERGDAQHLATLLDRGRSAALMERMLSQAPGCRRQTLQETQVVLHSVTCHPCAAYFAHLADRDENVLICKVLCNISAAVRSCDERIVSLLEYGHGGTGRGVFQPTYQASLFTHQGVIQLLFYQSFSWMKCPHRCAGHQASLAQSRLPAGEQPGAGGHR